MRAFIGANEPQGQFSDDIYYAYLLSSIIKKPKTDQLAFSKFEILNQPNLLWAIAEDQAKLLDAHCDRAVILCTSGLPIGVVASLAAGKPITFFHRHGFPRPEKSGIGSRFRPPKIKGENIAMIDSHYRTGFTSHLCYLESKENFGMGPVGLISPISFDISHLDEYRLPTKYYTALHYSDVATRLAKDLSISQAVLSKLIMNIDSGFWNYPPGVMNKTEFSAPGLIRRPNWFFGLGSDLSAIPGCSPKISELAKQINPTDEGIWELFNHPKLVKEMALLSRECIDYGKLDYLLGVHVLGTAIALSFAYYNRDIFSGSVISYMGGEAGFLPKQKSLSGKTILPIQARVYTGLYPVDIYLKTRELDGQLDQYLSVFPPAEPKRFMHQMYQSAIGELISRDVKFFSLIVAD